MEERSREEWAGDLDRVEQRLDALQAKTDRVQVRLDKAQELSEQFLADLRSPSFAPPGPAAVAGNPAPPPSGAGAGAPAPPRPGFAAEINPAEDTGAGAGGRDIAGMAAATALERKASLGVADEEHTEMRPAGADGDAPRPTRISDATYSVEGHVYGVYEDVLGQLKRHSSMSSEEDA